MIARYGYPIDLHEEPQGGFIEGAGRIVVMDRGQVADIGSRSELVERNGLYARPCRFQLACREPRLATVGVQHRAGMRCST